MVFPEPVDAQPITSRPVIMAGMPVACDNREGGMVSAMRHAG